MRRRRRNRAVRRTHHLHPAGCRRVWVPVRVRRRAVVYRGRVPMLLVVLALVAAAVTTGLVTGHVLAGAGGVVLLLVAWLGYALRVMRLLRAGPGGDGSAPPGGAGVREPRRPRLLSPAGAAMLAIEGDEPPGRAVALA